MNLDFLRNQRRFNVPQTILALMLIVVLTLSMAAIVDLIGLSGAQTKLVMGIYVFIVVLLLVPRLPGPDRRRR